MKTLELEQIGVREMDAVEHSQIDGGFLLVLEIAAACYLCYEIGKVAGKEYYNLTH